MKRSNEGILKNLSVDHERVKQHLRKIEKEIQVLMQEVQKGVKSEQLTFKRAPTETNGSDALENSIHFDKDSNVGHIYIPSLDEIMKDINTIEDLPERFDTRDPRCIKY